MITSAIGLIEISDLRRIYRIQQWEFWLSMACFRGVAVLGPIPGILLAIIIALLEFVWDGWRPHYAVLGRAVGVKGYHDITRYPEARLIPGLVLFRWDAPLFFANAARSRYTVSESAWSATFALVRVQAKLEPPLTQLVNLGGSVAISTIADVTFFGRDQTGREAQVTGSILVTFADWAKAPSRNGSGGGS